MRSSLKSNTFKVSAPRIQSSRVMGVSNGATGVQTSCTATGSPPRRDTAKRSGGSSPPDR